MIFSEFAINIIIALGFIWISTIFHEVGHLIVAKKHSLVILKNKQAIIKNGQRKNLLKCSIVIFGLELTPYINAQAHFDKNHYNELQDNSKKRIAIAGHISDFIIFILISVLTFFVKIVNLWVFIIYLFMIILLILSSIFCKNGDIYKIRKKIL